MPEVCGNPLHTVPHVLSVTCDPAAVDCPTCGGAGELTECANDGTHGCSHTQDREWTCTTCDGTGAVLA